ncbi:MAG TPA: hypothetical protein PKH39_10630 [Woeseiaceae bacterium]|nr:hypothetical protein [Woeseiaceae bacterium]
MEQDEKQRNYALAEELLDEQAMVAAMVSGFITMILGSGIYAVTALVVGGDSVSVLVIGIGAAIGLSMQYLGRGITTDFTVVASLLAALSYPVAKFFTIALYTVKLERIPVTDLFNVNRIMSMVNWVLSGLRLVDLLFCLGAIGAAAFLSKRRLSHDEGQAIRTYERR